MNALPLLTAAFVVLLLPGCYRGSQKRAAFSTAGPVYGFALLNRTGGAIREPRLEWGSITHEFPTTIGPNANVSQAYYTDPIPESVRMTWLDAKGQSHDAAAPVVTQDGWPPHNGQFCLVLLPDGKLLVEGVAARPDGEGYNLSAMHRVAADGGPRYIVATYNATAQSLSDLRVDFGEHQVNCENIIDAQGADVNAGWRFAHGMPYPITDEARVTWMGQGKQREATLDLKASLPANLDDVCIVFVIDEPPRVAIVPWSPRERWWMDARP